MSSKPRLGRGLEALIGGEPAPPDAGPAQKVVAVERIQANPAQPRKTFDEEELLRLSETIRSHGVLQPLLVRSVGDRFQLISGERRLRAAQLADVREVPIHVVDLNDQQVFEAALIENIQRADLNPVEKAQGFKDYLDRFGLTQEQLATRLGLDRTTISNLLGLLNLPAEVQDWVRTGQVSLGHAKVLKGMSDPARQVALGKEVIARSLSVHALEQQVKQQRTDEASAGPGDGAKPPAPEKTAHVQAIEDELRQRLAVRVAITLRAKDRGQIVLGFDSNDDFERLLESLRK